MMAFLAQKFVKPNWPIVFISPEVPVKFGRQYALI